MDGGSRGRRRGGGGGGGGRGRGGRGGGGGSRNQKGRRRADGGGGGGGGGGSDRRRRDRPTKADLLQFSLPDRHDYPRRSDRGRSRGGGRRAGSGRGSGSGSGSGAPAVWTEEQFQRAKFYFVLHRSAPAYGSDPDFPVDWNHVQQVVMTTANNKSGMHHCPVCLGTPQAARTTHCGHVYCLICILKMLQGADSGTCPICSKPVAAKDLRPVRIVSLPWLTATAIADRIPTPGAPSATDPASDLSAAVVTSLDSRDRRGGNRRRAGSVDSSGGGVSGGGGSGSGSGRGSGSAGLSDGTSIVLVHPRSLEFSLVVRPASCTFVAPATEPVPSPAHPPRARTDALFSRITLSTPEYAVSMLEAELEVVQRAGQEALEEEQLATAQVSALLGTNTPRRLTTPEQRQLREARLNHYVELASIARNTRPMIAGVAKTIQRTCDQYRAMLSKAKPETPTPETAASPAADVVAADVATAPPAPPAPASSLSSRLSADAPDFAPSVAPPLPPSPVVPSPPLPPPAAAAAPPPPPPPPSAGSEPMSGMFSPVVVGTPPPPLPPPVPSQPLGPPSSDAAAVKSTPPMGALSRASSADDGSPVVFRTYQSRAGEQAFVHPTSLEQLHVLLGSPLPPTLTAPVLEVESFTVDNAFRRRFPQFGHLPLLSRVMLCVLDTTEIGTLPEGSPLATQFARQTQRRANAIKMFLEQQTRRRAAEAVPHTGHRNYETMYKAVMGDNVPKGVVHAQPVVQHRPVDAPHLFPDLDGEVRMPGDDGDGGDGGEGGDASTVDDADPKTRPSRSGSEEWSFASITRAGGYFPSLLDSSDPPLGGATATPPSSSAASSGAPGPQPTAGGGSRPGWVKRATSVGSSSGGGGAWGAASAPPRRAPTTTRSTSWAAAPTKSAGGGGGGGDSSGDEVDPEFRAPSATPLGLGDMLERALSGGGKKGKKGRGKKGKGVPIPLFGAAGPRRR